MRFGILGPLRLRAGPLETSIPAHRERVVLALLLLNANQVVAPDQLIDALWGQAPPSTARAQVHNCISRLRRALTGAGIPGAILHTDPAGYLLRVEPGDLDVRVFEDTVARARSAVAEGRWDDSRTEFRAALALWRGPALAGVDSQQVRAAAARFDEQRSQVWEESLDVELALGRGTEVLGELTSLVRQYPLRERLRGQLMLALYRAGRQADALAAYRQAREEFDAELGVEPGSELAELHQRMLHRDPTLQGALPATALASTGEQRAAAVPRLLPRDIGDFTGRDDVISHLLDRVPDDSAGPSAIQAIDGMPGIGKTALAVHLAHRLAGRYPDAQLAIDLHGHSDRAPLEPAAALDFLLRQLGVPGDRIPEGLDERVALWRSELDGRRVLLLLDNAAGSDQVAPLLPSGSGCFTLVTSRRRLAGLDAVRPVSLDVLTAGESVALLHRIVGDRITAQPEAAAEVASLCGYLTLALRLAGARLNNRPGWTVEDLAARLRRTGPPLRELAVEGRTVSAAFQLSYDHLSGPARRLFRLLGIHPGPDIDVRAAATLADLDLDDADDVLSELVDAHMVTEPVAGRYRLHDLLREYAAEMATGDPEDERREALRRLADYYLHCCVDNSAVLEGKVFIAFDFQLGDRPRHAIGQPDSASALAWYQAELPTILAVVRAAYQNKLMAQVWRLVRAIWRYLFGHGYDDDNVEIHRLAIAAAEAEGDLRGIAVSHNDLAPTFSRTGRWEEALFHLDRAIEIRERLGGEPMLQWVSLSNRGLVLFCSARYPEAIASLLAGLAIHRSVGGARGVASAYANVGHVSAVVGNLELAEKYARLQWEHVEKCETDLERGTLFVHLGELELRLGRPERALDLYTRCMALDVIATIDPFLNALRLCWTGATYRTLGRIDEALRFQREALPLMDAFGDTRGMVEVRTGLGRTLVWAGELAEAEEIFRQAYGYAARIRLRREQLEALDGLATVLALTDPDRARGMRADVDRRYAELGLPLPIWRDAPATASR